MRNVLVLLGVLLASVVGLTSPAAAAPAGPSSVEFSVPGGTLHAGWVSDATLAAHPALYAQLGIPTPAQRARTAHGVDQPATSGTKCDGPVCAKVYGTGLTMTKIYTTAEGNVGCTNAHWVAVKGKDFAHGDIAQAAEGAVVCPDFPGSGTYYYNFDNNVPDRMPYTCPVECTVAVFWDFFGGEPMFDVHS